MLKIRTSVDNERYDKGMMIKCPMCGHNIGEVKYLDGIMLLRLKCRYCKGYIKVDAHDMR